MYGAWGTATQQTNSGLMQLRALDWDVDGPFKDYPEITVYHPSNASNGHAFANIGWTGWIGSITGGVAWVLWMFVRLWCHGYFPEEEGCLLALFLR